MFFIFLFFADRIVVRKKERLAHSQEHVPVSIGRSIHEGFLHLGYEYSLLAQSVNKYGHATYNPTLNGNEHFTPHQFAKFETKHHCTGTLTWNGHVLRTASSPQED